MDYIYYKEFGNGSLIQVDKIHKEESFYLSRMRLTDQNKVLLSTRSYRRRLEWLAVRYALLQLYSEEFVDISYDLNGKPLLTHFPTKEISISHSGDKMALYISENSIGLDIQFYTDKIVKVQKKYLHISELAYIETGDTFKKLHIIWAAKESLYKYYSKKNLSFKNQIWIEDFKILDKEFIIQGHYEIDKRVKNVDLTVILLKDEVLVYTI